MTQDIPQVKTVLHCKNSMLREGLKHTLLATRYKAYVADGAKAVDIMESDGSPEIELVIVDSHSHPSAAVDAVRQAGTRYPSAKVVVIADEFSLDGMVAMLEAGASGYCLSTIDCEVLVKYLDLVMLGETVFPSAMVLSSMASVGRQAAERPAVDISDGALSLSMGSPVRTLSSREAEILHCLMQGAPNKIIARKLEVAEATVKVHIKAILRKIRVTNRTQAAMWAVAHLPNAAGDDSWTAPR